MSIVEQAVDSIKTEESIKEICHGDVIQVVSKDIPIKMDLDTVETSKTEIQTNGSTSALKIILDESTKKDEAVTSNKTSIANDDATKPEQMDTDTTTNGNGNCVTEQEGSTEKNGKETDETNGESKTEAEAENEKKAEKCDEPSEPITKIDEKCKDSENSEENLKKNSIDDKEERKEEEEKAKDKRKNESVEMTEIEAKRAKIEEAKSDIAGGKTDAKDKQVKEGEKESVKVDLKNEKDEVDVEMKNATNETEKSTKETDKSTRDEGIKEHKDVEEVSKNDVDKASGEADTMAVRNSNKKEEQSEICSLSEKKLNKDEEPISIQAAEMNNECVQNDVDSENQDQLPGDSKQDNKDIKQNDNAEEVNGDVAKATSQNEDQTKNSQLKSEKSCDGSFEMKPETVKENNKKEEEIVLPAQKENSVVNKESKDENVKNEQENLNVGTSNVDDVEMAETKQEDHEMKDVNDKDTTKPAEKDIPSLEKEKPEDKDKLEAENLSKEDNTISIEKDAENKENITKEVEEEKEQEEEETLNQTRYIDENRYFESQTLVELSRIGWCSSFDKQQYVRGCLWSPDGTCILTAVNMDGMHVINLPTDLYSNETADNDRPVDKLESVINVKEGGTVYDYSWYPFMNSTMPETCCWLSSRQHCPIQLWDGFTGDLRGSYRGYDSVDEVESAFSVTFTSDAEKIIGGYKKTLKIFDTKSPGREYSVIPIKQPCSCFAVQETQSNIIATGSWNCAINLYDLRTPKLGSLVTLEEHVGGITFLKFNASAESLFSGARKDNNLLEWDMRNFSEPLRKLNRTVKTNQRIYFDLSPGEKWLASGDTDGLIRIWDLKSEEDTEECSFSLHKDCCNGVSFHPSRPMLATCSGQYHFLESDDDSELQQPREEMYENSLIFWWIGEISKGKEKDTVEKNVNDEKQQEEKIKS